MRDNRVPEDREPEQDDDAAHRLPHSLSGLTAGLESLVSLGAEFAQQNPSQAQSGVWWWGDSAAQLQQLQTEGVQRREASVLALFWPGENGPQVLLTERSPALAKHPGQISFPGGGAEEYDADPAATALREAQEETGLDPTLTTVLGTLPPAPIPISGFNVTPVVAVAEDPGGLVPQTGEVSRVLKLPVAALAKPEHRYTAVVAHRGPRLPSPAFLRTPAAAERPGRSPQGTGLAGELMRGSPSSAVRLGRSQRRFAPEADLHGISSDHAQPPRPPQADDAFFIWGFTGTLLDRMLERMGWAGAWDRSRELDPREFRR